MSASDASACMSACPDVGKMAEANLTVHLYPIQNSNLGRLENSFTEDVMKS